MRRFKPGDLAVVRCEPQWIQDIWRRYIGEMCSVVDFVPIHWGTHYDYQIKFFDGTLACCIDPVLHHITDPDPPAQKTTEKTKELEEIT